MKQMSAAVEDRGKSIDGLEIEDSITLLFLQLLLRHMRTANLADHNMASTNLQPHTDTPPTSRTQNQVL